MPRHLISSDAAIRAVKIDDTRSRLSDGDGLYLRLFVKGGAHGWRFDYSLNGRRNTLSFGTYPATSLALARRKADEARQLVSAGVDPSDVRKTSKGKAEALRDAAKRAEAGLPPEGSFEAVARDWFETKSPAWSDEYAKTTLARLAADIFPHLGRRPVGGISGPELLQVLRRIEERGAIESAHRARVSCSQVFRFAVATGRAERDPAHDIRDALRTPKVVHFPAITRPQRLGELLRACDGYAGTPVVRAALRLAPMLLLRPGELRFAEWSEIDLDGALWTVPAARMKREKEGKEYGPPHLVPLPSQAVDALRHLAPLTGGGKLVFRGERDHARAMSENTLNAALRAMGFSADEVVGHGFRATARTMLAEQLNMAEPVIEAQLAHSVKDSLGRAYNRTEFLAQRRGMMQAWADYLDRLRRGADVIQLRC